MVNSKSWSLLSHGEICEKCPVLWMESPHVDWKPFSWSKLPVSFDGIPSYFLQARNPVVFFGLSNDQIRHLFQRFYYVFVGDNAHTRYFNIAMEGHNFESVKSSNQPLAICYIAIENGIFIVDLPNLKMVIFQFANCQLTRGSMGKCPQLRNDQTIRGKPGNTAAQFLGAGQCWSYRGPKMAQVQQVVNTTKLTCLDSMYGG